MAALFTTPKRNDKTSGAHFVEPDVRRRTLLAHGSWRRVTRRIVVGAVCALTVSSLLMPSVSLAAERVNVGDTWYEAGAAVGDEAGTWAWDGADDMKLNGYDGGAIKAAGKLNIAYEGKNTVKTEPDYTGAAIKAQDGTNQKAELNITSSNSTDELNVTAEADAIKSTGDLSISGPGTVNTTSTTSDGIEAKGDLSITGSGTVNATGGTEGIQSKGKTTIDFSGTVIAKGGEGYGVAAGSDIIIKGGGKVEASSIEEAAIWADGNIEIEGASILTPEGGKVIDYRNKEELSNGIMYEAGQTIGTGDAVVDSPYNEAVAKSTVIAPSEETKPEEKPGETKPKGSKSEGTKTIKTVAVAATGAKTTGKLVATGDASSAAIVAAALAGAAAIAAGAVVSRKRS